MAVSNSKSKTSNLDKKTKNLLDKLTDQLSYHSPKDLDRIKTAFEFAALAHSDQKRLSGDPFITHPLEVALTLAGWKLDADALIAALLHDAVEDGGATNKDIVNNFGEDVGRIVAGVTKITGIRFRGSQDEEFAENLRKMLLVMAKDLRVVLVKLADRLHNMQTLTYLPHESQIANSRETLDIYAPLAERLGMGEVKGTLEDLAFPFLYPQDYQKLVEKTRSLYATSGNYIKKFRLELENLIKSQIPEAQVDTRLKHLYSLWRKLERPEIYGDLNKIHDFAAARVLATSIGECYLALGAIHGKYHPVPYLGVSDFIANPKPNGYQSIHTKVFGPEGRIVEIQIRTRAMHELAEHGVAAHWQYSQAKNKGMDDDKLEKGVANTPANSLRWIRQLVNWQHKVTDPGQFMEGLRFDALSHRNLVFSPRGDVYDLPRHATPVDFAYAVHSQMGHQTIGAKVNGKLVGLNHKLVNGDVIEIFLDRKKKIPSPGWLDFVVTNTAKKEISKLLHKVTA